MEDVLIYKVYIKNKKETLSNHADYITRGKMEQTFQSCLALLF